MPLLRGLKMRLFDNYVGTNLTSRVRNDYQSQFDLNELGNTFPATNVPCYVPNGFVHALEDEDCIIGLAMSTPNTLLTKNGHIYDFSIYQATSCVLFDSSRSSSGHLFDADNDSLLVPSEDGNFTIAFWVNPYSAPPGTYSIVSKLISGTSVNRFLIQCDTSSAIPVIRFSAATADGTSEISVESRVTIGRWSLVVAKCKPSSVELNVLCEDGFVSREKTASASLMGCGLSGENLYCGVGSDGISDPLHDGSFYLQQVLFWNKEITANEETELFSRGRGKVRFSDTAVPETFTEYTLGSSKYGSHEFGTYPSVDIDANGDITRLYVDNVSESPYRPCKTCDTEPFCYPGAMADPSPDSITLSVSWTANLTGCVPTETSFTMLRLPKQIVQGFVFGRTFESEKIPLSCGGYIRFFLESTPYHWSLYRYRQYLGVETTFGGRAVYAKYAITMGSSLVRNAVTGGSNRFTSPSPAGVSFNFPFTDSFSDYANDIVAAGWCDVAEDALYEQFSPETCTTNSIDASCIVANGYRFGVGVDRPEDRGGDCGWQLGISEITPGPQQQDSMYNYRVACGSPSYSTATVVVPSFTELNRPFSAIAYGLIGIHDSNGKHVDREMPFSDFSAVLTPSMFIRPEPFDGFNRSFIRSIGPAGCIDCEIAATFDYDDSSIATGGSTATKQTNKINSNGSPTKTLSAVAPVVLSGASGDHSQPGYGLLRILGSPASTPSTISGNGTFSDPDENESQWLLTLGGSLKPGGEIQFTSQVDNYSRGVNGYGYLLENLRDDKTLDWNSASTAVPPRLRGTKVDPYIFYQSGTEPAGEQPGNTIPVTASQIRRKKPDRGTLGGPTDTDLVPVADSQLITSSNCDDCHEGCESSTFLADAEGLQYAADIKDYGVLPLAAPSSDFSFSSGTQTTIECDGRQILKNSATFANGPPASEIQTPPTVTAQITGIKIVHECPDLVAKIQYTVTQLIFVNTVSREYTYLALHYTDLNPLNPLLYVEIDNRASYYGSNTQNCEYEAIVNNDGAIDASVVARELAHEINPYQSGAFTAVVRDQPVGNIIGSSSGFFDFEGVLVCDFKTDILIYGFTENREAIFRIEDTDTCLRPGNADRDRSATLTFLEDRQVDTRTPYSNVGSLAGSIPDGTNDFDQAVLDAWYSGNSQFGENPAIPACKCDEPAFDPPTLYYSVPTPPAIDFSNAVVTLEMVTPSIHQSGHSEQYKFTLPASFSEEYDGEHVLTAEDGEMNWASESTDSSPMFAILRSSSGTQLSGAWTLEISSPTTETDTCRKIAARYRLSGFPYSRWNPNGDNQMMLVSADWSIGRWPVFLTVEPVV